jgi:hypothetical protein
MNMNLWTYISSQAGHSDNHYNAHIVIMLKAYVRLTTRVNQVIWVQSAIKVFHNLSFYNYLLPTNLLCIIIEAISKYINLVYTCRQSYISLQHYHMYQTNSCYMMCYSSGHMFLSHRLKYHIYISTTNIHIQNNKATLCGIL